MKDFIHKEDFENDKNKILIGFVLVLLAFLLIIVKFKLFGTEEKQVNHQATTIELFATWYQAHCVHHDSIVSIKN
ncbi:MAG: hypothetical protein IT258_15095 [Saprospiraceae bacterium]|nr:hypothetical protein [Saprospiraceae bacterium]